jgi:hypothetical protein
MERKVGMEETPSVPLTLWRREKGKLSSSFIVKHLHFY